MIIKLKCNEKINPEAIVVDSDPIAIAEFRRALANKGMNVNDRIVVNFDDTPGHIVAYSYPPPMWNPNMMTMSFKHLTSKETMKAKEMSKIAKEKGGIKIRWQDEATGMMMTQDTRSGIIVPSDSK